MKHILLLSSIIFFCSCSSTDSGLYKKSSNVVNKLKNDPPAPWSAINSEGSDYALQNINTKSLFLFNSACRKYEASTLSALTSSILTGIEDVKITEKNNVFYQEREGVEVAANGKLDGILRFFRIVTIQKNNCIYDYVLISTNQKNLNTDTPALKVFIQRIILN
ncbi:MAG: hypothetical protein PHY93_04880 [Bacteriovorax sp.]|nr:hypothetical protein [Bacteriovorax sp.]